MKSLKFVVVLGALTIIKRIKLEDTLLAFGISLEQMETVTKDDPWVAQERGVVTRVLDAALYATMDLIGVPRFPASAEYQAAIIYKLVSPVNIMPACRWMAESKSAEDMADGTSIEAQAAKPEQLHAMITALYERESSLAPAFEKKADAEIAASSRKAS